MAEHSIKPSVYLLTDNVKFYVGYTERPVLARFGQHLRDACYKDGRGASKRPLHLWLKSHVERDSMPKLEVLKKNATKSDENFFIAKYASAYGLNCLNTEKNDCRPRWNVGERHGMAKLSEDDVIMIRMAYKFCVDKIEFMKFLAIKLGIDRGSVRNIIGNKTWKNIILPESCSFAFLDVPWNFVSGSLERNVFAD